MGYEEIEIDREAVKRSIVEVARGRFQDLVATGEFTQAMADQATGSLLRSPTLDQAIDAEVERLSAVMNNRLH